MKKGFTLIELSIVLVIIGLIIGGILVGRDLINTSAIRATISQIDKYNAAANTFQGKYGYLPGDIPDPTAIRYGFLARGTDCGGRACAGEGDGNGVIEGYNGGVCDLCPASGEQGMFWVDLSTAGLINGGFSAAIPTGFNGLGTYEAVTGAGLSQYFPIAKLGEGNYFYVWSGGFGEPYGVNDNVNYYGLSAIASADFVIHSLPGLTVQQAYSIDTKIDDGLPQSGNVTAIYVDSWVEWAEGARCS